MLFVHVPCFSIKCLISSLEYMLHKLQVDSFLSPRAPFYAVYLTKMCFLHKCDTNVNYKNVENIKNYAILKITYHYTEALHLLAYFLSGFLLIHLKSMHNLLFRSISFY